MATYTASTDLYQSKRSKIKNFKANVSNKTGDDGTVSVSINYQFTKAVEALNTQRVKIGRDNLKKIEAQLKKIEQKGEVDDNLKTTLTNIRSDLHNTRLDYSRAIVKLYNAALDSYNDAINKMYQFYLQHSEFSGATLSGSNASNQTVSEED